MTIWEIAEQFEFKEVKKACLKYILEDLGKEVRNELQRRESERLERERREEEEKKRKLEAPESAPVESTDSEGEGAMEVEGDALQSAGKKRRTGSSPGSASGGMELEAEEQPTPASEAEQPLNEEKGKEKLDHDNAADATAVSPTDAQPRVEKGEEYKEVCRKLIFEVLEKKLELPKKYRSVYWRKEDANAASSSDPIATSTSSSS